MKVLQRQLNLCLKWMPFGSCNGNSPGIFGVKEKWLLLSDVRNISRDDVVTFELCIARVILYTTGYGKELLNLIFFSMKYVQQTILKWWWGNMEKNRFVSKILFVRNNRLLSLLLINESMIFIKKIVCVPFILLFQATWFQMWLKFETLVNEYDWRRVIMQYNFSSEKGKLICTVFESGS